MKEQHIPLTENGERDDAIYSFTLLTHRANRETTATAVATEPVDVAKIEVKVVGVATAEDADDAQRARPIEAFRPLVADSRAGAIARSGQEDAVAIGAGYAVAVNAVKSSPHPSTFSVQFILFCKGGHTPRATPLNVGYIIIQLKSCFIVNYAVVAICAVFGH